MREPLIMRAEGVEDALELIAANEKARGWTWFRGQPRAWPPIPTWARHAAERGPAWEAKSKGAAERFYAWAQNFQDLQPLTADGPDQMFAVMQHYGMPTLYLDFTTDARVAAFFASDTQEPPTDEACIYCLNKADLADVWRHFQREQPNAPSLEFIDIDVKNLWRLQAQKGMHLFCPVANWHQIYPMDRVLFKHDGYLTYPTRGAIYPTQQSPLESLLNEFFIMERMYENEALIREMTYGLDLGDGGFGAEGVRRELVRAVPDVHASWVSRSSAWSSAQPERYGESQHVVVPLQVPTSRPEFAALKRAISAGLLAAFKDGSLRRSNRASIVLAGAPLGPLWPDNTKVQELIGRIWDGMRLWPYSDELIAAAMGRCVALCAHFAAPAHQILMDESMDTKLGPLVEVEFAVDGGAYSRAMVPADNLVRALRPDIARYVDVNSETPLNAAHLVLQSINDPSRAYDFDAFVGMFGEYIIPHQVIWRNSSILFGAGRVEVFGRP